MSPLIPKPVFNPMKLKNLFIAATFAAIVNSVAAMTLQPHAVPAVSSLFEEGAVAESVERQKPVDLAEILSREMASVAYIRKGPVAGDFLLRGLGRDNILVTLDGGRTCGACPNRMDPPAFHVGTSRIESVWVRPGPFDVEEGGVVGGIVRLQTEAQFAEDFLDTSLFGGAFSTMAANAAGGILLDSGQISGGIDYRRGDPYKDGNGDLVTRAPKGPAAYRPANLDRTAYEIFGGDFSASRFSEDAEWILNGGFNAADDVLYPGLRMDADYDRSGRLGLSYQRNKASDFADRWAVQLSGSTVDHLMDDGYRVSSASAPMWRERGYMMRTKADTRFLAARLRAEKDTGSISWLYGVGYEDRNWDADNVLMNVRNDMIPNVVNRSLSAWANATWQMSDWDLEAGARIEVARSYARDSLAFLESVRGPTSNQQDDILPSGYLLARRSLVDNLWLQLGIGHGERLPDPQERYINLRNPNAMMPSWVGNPDLDPVTNTEFQARMGGTAGSIDYSAGGFYAYLGDLIYLASLPDSTQPIRTYENIDAELYGFDADIGWQVIEEIRLEAGLAWQQGRKLTLASGNDDRDLGEIPPLSGRIAGVWSPIDSVDITAEGLFADAQNDLDTDLGEVRINGYAVMNARAAWEINEVFEVGVGVDNVFDENYALHNAYLRDPFSAGVVINEPGRFWFLRVAASF